MKKSKGAILEKYRGPHNDLIAQRKTILSVAELIESIRTIWDVRAERADFMGQIITDMHGTGPTVYTVMVWESVALKDAGADPVYRFIIKPLEG